MGLRFDFGDGDERQITPRLDDHMVRAMADRNHQPREHWMHGALAAGMATEIPISLFCAQCGQEWPCATRKQLAVWDNPELAAMVLDTPALPGQTNS